MTGAHWLILAAALAVALSWLAFRRPRVRASDAALLPVPMSQTDPRVADLEHMDETEIAGFIADCAEAAAVIGRQWGAANAELAERHRAMRRLEGGDEHG